MRESLAADEFFQRASQQQGGKNRATREDCIPVTAPTLMLYLVASVVEVARDVVKLRVDWMASERTVYLDGRGHPVNAYRSEWDYRPDLVPSGLACDVDVARRFLKEE